jgi:hypothetical protein
MKTLNLINKYFRIIEQDEQNPADATEAPADATEVVAPPEKQVGIPGGEKMLFDLLIRAFKHTPEPEDLAIIDTIKQEYSASNLNEVVATIAKLLQSSKGDIISTLDKSI